MCFDAGLEGMALLLVHMILLLPFLQNLYCPLHYRPCHGRAGENSAVFS